MVRRRTHLAVFAVAAAAGIGYVLAVGAEPYPGHPLIKSSPLVLLALLAFLRARAPVRGVLVVAFLASAVGDCLLGVDRVANLRPALFSFLVTQVLYAWVFWRRTRLSRPALILCGLEVIGLLAMWAVMLPRLPEGMVVPVIVYSLALLGMAAGAAVSSIRGLLPLGGALFFVADSLIAINQFVSPFPESTRIIVSIYTTGQLMIGYAVLFGRPGEDASRPAG
jgi:uncharacterized membrane protein YhhN